MNHKPRCSELDRLLACPDSAVPAEFPYKPQTPEADQGTAKHEAIATEEAGNEVDVEEIAQRYDDDADEIRKALGAYRRLRAEVLGWCGESPRILVELPVDGPVCSGTLDWVALTSRDGVLEQATVMDHKSGWSTTEHRAQLRGYVSCLRATFGMPSSGYITAVEGHLRHGERIVRNYSDADIDEFDERVAKALARVGKRVQAGSHCMFCPRQMGCSARAEYLRGSVAALVEVQPGVAITREQLGMLYDRYRDAMRAARHYEKLLTEELELAPIALPDGRRIELHEEETRAVDVGAIQVLIEQFGFRLEHLRDAVSVSKSGLEKAAKQIAPYRGAAALMRRIMGALEQAGAMRSKLKREKVVIEPDGAVGGSDA